MHKLADISLFESYQAPAPLCSLAVFNAPNDDEEDFEGQALDSFLYPQFKDDNRTNGADIGDIGSRPNGPRGNMYSSMVASLDANVEAVMYNLAELKAVLPKLLAADEPFNFLNDSSTHWFSRMNTALDKVFADLKTMFTDTRYNGDRLTKVIAPVVSAYGR